MEAHISRNCVTGTFLDIRLAAIALAPGNSIAWNNLGNVLVATGQVDEAITAYRQAIAGNPDDLRAQSNLLYALHLHGGTDAAAYDPESKQIFVSTRDGNIHVFHEDSPDKFSVVDTIKTQVGAKTMGLDTRTHKLFLDTADFAAAPAPTAEQPHPRGAAIPGTFHILVYGL